MPHSLVNAALVAAAAFFEAAERCLRKDGLALVNVCLERKSDPTADRIAAGFEERSWRVRLLDSPGGVTQPHRPGGKGEVHSPRQHCGSDRKQGRSGLVTNFGRSGSCG